MEMQYDERITVWHLSLLMTLLYYWEAEGACNPTSITRRKVMNLSHIHSLPTYHKYMRELVLFGYIRYVPSYHPLLGSLVYLNESLLVRNSIPQ